MAIPPKLIKKINVLFNQSTYDELPLDWTFAK